MYRFAEALCEFVASAELSGRTVVGYEEKEARERIWNLLQPPEHLHWVDTCERRGLGTLVKRVNHLAIIVSDVGRSLSFYTDVLGLQQIRRPNFDRHGAWLTCGNVEIHLIKGSPVVHSGDDLIVGHIALESDHIDLVLERLKKMGVHFEQNVSVPTAETSRSRMFETEKTCADGALTQFFIRDPDGYYLEFCNCDVLTKFCFGQDDAEGLHNDYAEGIARARPRPHPPWYAVLQTVRWKRRALKRLELVRQGVKLTEMAMDGSRTPPGTPAQSGLNAGIEVDQRKLDFLKARRNTYGDMCQGYSDEQLEDALQLAGNDIPTALGHLRELKGSAQVLVPPPYLITGAQRYRPPAIVLPSLARTPSPTSEGSPIWRMPSGKVRSASPSPVSSSVVRTQSSKCNQPKSSPHGFVTGQRVTLLTAMTFDGGESLQPGDAGTVMCLDETTAKVLADPVRGQEDVLFVVAVENLQPLHFPATPRTLSESVHTADDRIENSPRACPEPVLSSPDLRLESCTNSTIPVIELLE